MNFVEMKPNPPIKNEKEKPIGAPKGHVGNPKSLRPKVSKNFA